MTEYTYPCPNCQKEIITMDEFDSQSCECVHKLMAEKKQLLEACEAIIEAMGGECDIDDCPSCVAYRLAKAAIAAAEGE